MKKAIVFFSLIALLSISGMGQDGQCRYKEKILAEQKMGFWGDKKFLGAWVTKCPEDEPIQRCSDRVWVRVLWEGGIEKTHNSYFYGKVSKKLNIGKGQQLKVGDAVRVWAKYTGGDHFEGWYVYSKNVVPQC